MPKQGWGQGFRGMGQRAQQSWEGAPRISTSWSASSSSSSSSNSSSSSSRILEKQGWDQGSGTGVEGPRSLGREGPPPPPPPLCPTYFDFLVC